MRLVSGTLLRETLAGLVQAVIGANGGGLPGFGGHSWLAASRSLLAALAREFLVFDAGLVELFLRGLIGRLFVNFKH